MCFLRNRTVRHRSGLKTCHNRIYAFHFLKLHTLLRVLKIHQSTQVRMLFFFIYQTRILFEHLIVPTFGRLLQQMDGSRIVQMRIGSASHLVAPLAVKGYIGFKSQRIIGCGMKRIDIVFDILDGNSADAADRIGEILVNDIFINTKCLKNLGTLIRLDRRNTHLGCNLYNTGDNCMVIIINCGIIIFV